MRKPFTEFTKEGFLFKASLYFYEWLEMFWLNQWHELKWSYHRTTASPDISVTDVCSGETNHNSVFVYCHFQDSP